MHAPRPWSGVEPHGEATICTSKNVRAFTLKFRFTIPSLVVGLQLKYYAIVQTNSEFNVSRAGKVPRAILVLDSRHTARHRVIQVCGPNQDRTDQSVGSAWLISFDVEILTSNSFSATKLSRYYSYRQQPHPRIRLHVSRKSEGTYA